MSLGRDAPTSTCGEGSAGPGRGFAMQSSQSWQRAPHPYPKQWCDQALDGSGGQVLLKTRLS